MDIEEEDAIMGEAICTWGRNAQIDMKIEESSELNKALLKYRRNPSRENKINVLEELADDGIMHDQMKLIFIRTGEDARIYTDFREKKLKRTKERLDDDHKKN